MRILIVKTSSLGDVIHNLPAVSDILRHFPEAEIDWCVEESFADIPRLHSGVRRVLPVAIRRWRKAPFQRTTWQEFAEFRRSLRAQRYDFVIDTQGLLKSALLGRLADGVHLGFAADSAREPLSSRFYDRCFSVSRALHAVLRNRGLSAAALGYEYAEELDYGITTPPGVFAWMPSRAYVVFLTATSRDDKLWHDAHWLALGERLNALGFVAVFPAGSLPERERAKRLASTLPLACVAPPMRVAELASLLVGARAAVGVDTGLTHLAVALKVPTIAIYTATDPGLTGVFGAGFHRNLGGKGRQPSPDEVREELAAVLG